MTTPKEALERIIQIYERNVGRQNEKLADIPLVARRALASLQGEDAVERVARVISRAMLDNPTGGTSEERAAKRRAIASEYAAAYVADCATGLVPDEAGGTAQQSDAAFDIEETRRENAENLRTLDAIADYVGCLHDEELTVDHVRQHYMKLENAAQQQRIEDAGRIANAQAYSAEREVAVRADSTANLISIIADIREKTGLGGKPMLNELADAIVAEMDRRVADEREKCASIAEDDERQDERPKSVDVNRTSPSRIMQQTIAAAIRSGGGE